MSLRKPDTIRQYISKAESDIQELKQRKEKLNKKIQDIQDNILELSEDEARAEISELTSTREVTQGAIDDRRQRIESLQEELDKAKEIEADEARFQELVSLSQKAHEAMEKRNEIVRWINETLDKKMLEFADNQSQWKSINYKFRQLTKQLEPSFATSHKIEYENGEDLNRKRKAHREARKNLIDEVEAAAGVDTKPASRTWTSSRWHGVRNFVVSELEDTNFNLIQLQQGPLKRRQHRQRVEQEKRKQQDSEAAE